jgi:hypothetical protein
VLEVPASAEAHRLLALSQVFRRAAVTLGPLNGFVVQS